MGAGMNRVILDGEVMFCGGGRLSVHFSAGCIEVIGNRKQQKRGERVRIEGRAKEWEKHRNEITGRA